MITEDNIDIIYDEQDHYLEVIAKLELTYTYPLDNNTIFGYKHREELINATKKRLKREILHKLYGEIEKQARKTYIEVEKVLQYNPHLSFDDYKTISEAFSPLLNLTNISKK
jgi:hypothetical protein